MINIPVSPLNCPDIPTWLPNSDGIYFVKRGYWFAHYLHHLAEDKPETSIASDSTIWKALWNQKIHPSVSLWPWQAAMEKLLTRANLYKRGIVSNPNYTFCGHPCEDVLHCIYQCPRVWGVWTLWNPEFQFENFTILSRWHMILSTE